MRAIQFNGTIPRYALGMALGKLVPGILWSGLSCTYSKDVPEPDLPSPEWVKINTRFGGICGSDLSTIQLHVSPYFSPFYSFPFTIGHENTGRILEVGAEVAEWRAGECVVVEPLLWCRPRGFTNLCKHCSQGEINLCERFTEGDLAPGPYIGGCRDSSGSWSQTFLAHSSQLYRVPDKVSDENALMVEPFAVGLHAVIQNFPNDDETVLIVGAGTIGLCTLAALRALDSKANVLVLARYPFQSDAARKLGASEVILQNDADPFEEVARRTGAKVFQPLIGKRVVYGGADLTFDCVGSDAAIDDALRLTRNGGHVVLVGVPRIAKGIDWTAIFAQELTVQAAYIYHHAEEFEGKKWKAFDLALDLMASGKLNLGWMVTHKFSLDEYPSALNQLGKRGKTQAIKAVFSFDIISA